MPARSPVIEFPCGRLASRDLADALRAAATLRLFDRGEFVVHQGDDPDFLGVVLSGRVKVVKHAPNGREVILHLLGPGTVFGVVPALDGQPYPASVVAVEPSEVGRVSTPRFLAILRSEPDLMVGMLRGFGQRMRAVAHAVVSAVTTEVPARLAANLLDAAAGTDEVRMTRQELADLCGTTVETAIRVTRGWQREGIVALSRGRIEIKDRARLQALAGR